MATTPSNLADGSVPREVSSVNNNSPSTTVPTSSSSNIPPAPTPPSLKNLGNPPPLPPPLSFSDHKLVEEPKSQVSSTGDVLNLKSVSFTPSYGSPSHTPIANNGNVADLSVNENLFSALNSTIQALQQAHAPRKENGLSIKFTEKYDGRDRNQFESFWARLMDYLNVLDASMDRKIIFAKFCFTDIAAAAITGRSFNTLSEVKQVLCNFLQIQPHDAYSLLLSVKQTSGEDLNLYWQRFHQALNLVSAQFREPLHPQAAITMFVTNSIHGDVVKHLQFSSLQKAYNVLLQEQNRQKLFTATLNNSNSIANRTSSNRPSDSSLRNTVNPSQRTVPSLSTPVSAISATAQQKTSITADSRSTVKPSVTVSAPNNSESTCNYCKRPGHFKRDCPKLKQKEGQNASTSSQKN